MLLSRLPVDTIRRLLGFLLRTKHPADFRLVALDEETCVGAFFQLPPGTAGPDWIVGDTFLVRSLSPPELLVNRLR